MSLVEHPKSYQRWCAAVLSDYEMIINQFLGGDSWSFDTFKKLVASSGTCMLHNCAVSKGVRMTEHLEQVETVLIQLAKEFWLAYPMQEMFNELFSDQFFEKSPKNSIVKMMVGGFYLTYCMFEAGKISGVKVNVSIDARDLLAFYYFRMCLVECSIPDSIKFDIHGMILSMAYAEAFQIVSESQQTGINPANRNFSNVTRSKVCQINGEVRFYSSKFLDPSEGASILKNVEAYEAARMKIKKDSNCGVPGFAKMRDLLKQDAIMPGPSMDNSDHVSGPSTAESLEFGVNVSELVKATSICASVADAPVLSVQNLMGNSIVDRTMMYEARKKMERAVQRVKASSGTVGYKAMRPYIEDGGIFGRKNLKEGDTEEAVVSNTGPGTLRESSGNLWNYVNTTVFGGLSNLDGIVLGTSSDITKPT